MIDSGCLDVLLFCFPSFLFLLYIWFSLYFLGVGEIVQNGDSFGAPVLNWEIGAGNSWLGKGGY